MSDKLSLAIDSITQVCNEWIALKNGHLEKGDWIFSYKLYPLSYKIEDDDDFNFIAGLIFEEWCEAARIAAGHTEKMWKYNEYFEHDKHHGSYFGFREDYESSDSLDFWANGIGLEWDSTPGDAWYFTPFEKAIFACYGKTRFSTDRLTPKAYSSEEIDEVVLELTTSVLPMLREKLKERKAVIAAYDKIKSSQCGWCEI